MKHYFCYVRVSTAKQGEHGVSLQEQRGAIEEYARRHSLSVTGWYEEKETAAKRGRQVFEKMLRERRKEKIGGVIVHKIDRSARNFFDWAGINELMDDGVEVHIASENQRIETRGDRLAADVQAVVAVDYIRNLREETIKGLNGRLKQGLYPFKAPLGYLDRGGGKAKEIDPVTGPLVSSAFKRYATGMFTLESLSAQLVLEGLHSRSGKPLSANTLWKLLRNPFYMGIIRIERRAEHFAAIHEPVVTKRVFDDVQAVLDGRGNRATLRTHDFLFRRLFTCATCGKSLIGEMQKGRVYYRCHTRTCFRVCIREDTVDAHVREVLTALTFPPDKERAVVLALSLVEKNWHDKAREKRESVRLALGKIEDRLLRLTDAYLDGVLEREIFEERKVRLLRDRRGLEDHEKSLTDDPRETVRRLQGLFELAKSARLSYESGDPENKRSLVLTLTSNRTVSEKCVAVELSNRYRGVAKWLSVSVGDPTRDHSRLTEESAGIGNYGDPTRDHSRLNLSSASTGKSVRRAQCDPRLMELLADLAKGEVTE